MIFSSRYNKRVHTCIKLGQSGGATRTVRISGCYRFGKRTNIDDSQERHTRASAYRWVRGFTGAAVNTVHRTTTTTEGNQNLLTFIRLVGPSWWGSGITEYSGRERTACKIKLVFFLKNSASPLVHVYIAGAKHSSSRH
ncbi:unnamed protein product, partial [Ectocarpus sp. 13 AM-2016]